MNLINDNLKLKIISLNEIIFFKEIKKIQFNTPLGDRTILKNHINYTTILFNSTLKIIDINNKEYNIEINDGYLFLMNNKISIIYN